MKPMITMAWLVAACAATAAAAKAPAASPLPLPRPAAAAPVTSARPLARPVLAEVTRMATNDGLPMALPTRRAPLASPVPKARPAEEVILASAPVPKKRDGLSHRGSVCGNPAIKGVDIAPIRAAAKGCGLDEGVSVTSVSGVALSPPAKIDCATAEALNDWVVNAVLPSVGTSGGGVRQLQVAGSYVCRPRNNQRGNRVSEHGKGHAVDIGAIVLENGKVISVLADWGKGSGGRILKAIRASACGTFTTVLGPGSDRFHRDHLHLDTARGRGAYCH